VPQARSQTICSSASKATTLYCTPIVALGNFSVVPSAPVSIPVPPAFSALNAEVGEQVTQLPTPSPASAVIFSFGPSGFTSQRDLGPIFSERPGTIGKHKLGLAVAYQYFSFDQISNINLKQIPVQFTACSYPTATGCSQFIQTSSRLDLKVHQVTAYLTFGITSRIDVSAAIPILDVRMGMSAGCIVCTQTQPNGYDLIFNPNQAARWSSGIGDVTFRGKALLIKDEKAELSAGVDVRAPSGDEVNFRGSGTTGVRPFAAFDYRTHFIVPHANIGYLRNGNSILAAQTNVPQHLPDSLTYTAGVDLNATRRFGMNVDLLGQTFFSAQRVFEATRQPLNTPDTACTNIVSACQYETLNTNSLAIGAKFNPAGNLIIAGDVLIKLDHNGLHYKPSPMIGISYAF
jgi:hypothetical protein